MIISPFNKEQTTFIVSRRGNRGVPFFLKENSMNCDLCGKYFSVLNPIDFSNLIWIQGDTLQLISKNPDLKKLKLDLCYSCQHKVFQDSIPCIRFKQELFEVMSGRK